MNIKKINYKEVVAMLNLKWRIFSAVMCKLCAEQICMSRQRSSLSYIMSYIICISSFQFQKSVSYLQIAGLWEDL